MVVVVVVLEVVAQELTSDTGLIWPALVLVVSCEPSPSKSCDPDFPSSPGTLGTLPKAELPLEHA